MDRNRRKRVFRKIHEMIQCDMLFADRNGYVLESTDEKRLGDYIQLPQLSEALEIFRLDEYMGYHFKTKEDKDHFLLIRDLHPENEKLLKIVGLMLLDEFEEISKEDFIREILMNKVSEEHILNHLKKFHIQLNEKLVTFIVQIKVEFSEEVETILSSLFPDDIVLKYNNMRYVIIKKLNDDEPVNTGKLIFKAIFEELVFEPRIGVGTEIDNFLNLKESFDKAVMALEIGSIHYSTSKIFNYKSLVVPLLIKNMNIHELESMYHDIAENLNSVINDEELILTALRFFENDLNITETSRKLFVHRNTLIYRLNKIHKLTYFDLRKFEDALNFNIGLYMHNVIKKNTL